MSSGLALLASAAWRRVISPVITHLFRIIIADSGNRKSGAGIKSDFIFAITMLHFNKAGVR